jgi:6-phosphogluconolactonase
MNNLTEHFFSTSQELFKSVTLYCQQRLTQACIEYGEASFLVSGGSTPAPLYQALARQPMPWQQIKVALVDERWVEPEDKGSNQTFIQSTLLQGNAAAANFTVMKNQAKTALEGLAHTDEQYSLLPQPFDLTILGMGSDGHTASLFPDADGLTAALSVNHNKDLAAIMANRSHVTGHNIERMTLSLAGLLKSRELILLIIGEEKLDVYKQALVETEHKKMPVSAVLQQQKVPIRVFWAP